jgi:hypothetical protein
MLEITTDSSCSAFLDSTLAVLVLLVCLAERSLDLEAAALLAVDTFFGQGPWLVAGLASLAVLARALDATLFPGSLALTVRSAADRARRTR